MDDELVSTPDFLGYAQLEHKELLYKMPGQGWRNLDLVDDPAGAVSASLHAVDATRDHPDAGALRRQEHPHGDGRRGHRLSVNFAFSWSHGTSTQSS